MKVKYQDLTKLQPIGAFSLFHYLRNGARTLTSYNRFFLGFTIGGRVGRFRHRHGSEGARRGQSASWRRLEAVASQFSNLENCGPRRHTVDDLFLAARHLHHRGHSDIHTWSHDLESAYRQLLLANQELALILIITDEGPVIFMNHILLFGATGGVFDYGRFSDFIMHMGRFFHFVDDFTGIESAKTASSAFEGFESLNIKFGCRTKFEKRSPPLPTQHLLGVNFDVSTNKAIVAP